jgi:serine/threonine protein kinase
MPLEPGQRLANYEIVAPLGAGGMGEVWRARDSRLGREVAIKALPDAFARDPERLGRFEREAKLLASLNHPNVGAIYGLEVVDGHRYLVLEDLEGETLAALVGRGPVSIGETVEICAQIAAALESAHESGIVHRDLKPGNVMLTRNGAVKVLDFGLAKAGGVGGDSDISASASPTMTYGVTQAGMVLGTAAYMSPEQARGKAVDKRTDIWSFGCVLFECLTGRQAFEGETVSDLIAHILTSEPDWNHLPAATPPRVRDLLRRCLEKDARRRLRDMGDARIELEETLAPRGSSSMAVPASVAASIDAAARPKKRRIGLELFAAIAGALAAVVATKLVSPLIGPKSLPRPSVRFEIAENDSMKLSREPSQLAVSPDGSLVVFLAGDTLNTNRLWIRPLASMTARPLPGTEDGGLPFFSPDGQSVGFFTPTKLKRVSIATGDVDEIADVKRARGGTWSRKDQIVFAPTSDGPLFVVAATGGEPRQLTTLDSTRGESGHRFPVFLPDGNHFLYSSLPPHQGKYTICAGSLAGGKPDSVATLPGGAWFVRPGWLLYQNIIGLYAQRFDPASRKVRGAPIPLRENALPSLLSGSAAVCADNGVLAFAAYKSASSRFIWIDAAGKEVGKLPFGIAQYTGDMDFSPDGRYLVYGRAEGTEATELWIGDLTTGGERRFATEPAINTGPFWSPDGSHIAYMHSEGGPQTIVIKSAQGNEPGRRYLEKDALFKVTDCWTPDGKRFLFDRQDPATRWDLWIIDIASGTAKPLLAGPFSEQFARVSPDGRYLAYVSDETGRQEIYVRPFDAPGPSYQVTTTGGIRCYWSSDSKQLCYQTFVDQYSIRAADVLPGPEFRLGPARVFQRVPAAIETGAVTPDGRYAIQLPAGRPLPAGIMVVTDWTSLLRRR